jgi:hypothetical protein
MQTGGMRIVAAVVVGVLCVGCKCESGSGGPPAPSASASASASAVPSASAAAPKAKVPGERHSLAPRTAIEVQAVKDARAKVLTALDAAQGQDPKAALSGLAEARTLDPTGAVLAAVMAQLSLATEDKDAAIGWANQVTASPGAAAAAVKLASDVAAKAAKGGGKAPAGRSVTEPKPGPYDSIDAACKAITTALRGANGPESSANLGAVKDVQCEPDAALVVENEENLKQAVPLRVTVKGEAGSQLMAWVAIQTAKGWLLHGPVENLYSPGLYGVSNDYAIALERAEVLPGGSSEIVVRVIERLTIADLALNEAAEVDQTRVVILTLDREGVVESKPFVLNRSQTRSAIDTGGATLPKGGKPSKALGKTEGFALKVKWEIPNGIELKKDQGDLKPPFEGKLALFPPPPADPGGESKDPAP